MPISHKHLLEKYIDHVTRFTGIDFVQPLLEDDLREILRHGGHSDVEFTSEEVEFFERTQRMLDGET